MVEAAPQARPKTIAVANTALKPFLCSPPSINALPVPLLRQVSQNSCFTCMGAHFRSNMAPDPEMLPETSSGRLQGEFWTTFGCSRYCFGVSCRSKIGPFFAWERYHYLHRNSFWSNMLPIPRYFQRILVVGSRTTFGVLLAGTSVASACLVGPSWILEAVLDVFMLFMCAPWMTWLVI